MKHYRKIPGFSMHEILVVVAIVGILLGIAIPMLNNAKNKASRTQAETNLTILNTIASQMRSAGVITHGQPCLLQKNHYKSSSTTTIQPK